MAASATKRASWLTTTTAGPVGGQAADEAGERPLAAPVDAAGRLVEDDQVRAHRSHRGDRQPLPLPARQVAGVLAGRPRQVEAGELRLGSGPPGIRRHAQVREPVSDLGERRVVDEVGGRVLGDVAGPAAVSRGAVVEIREPAQRERERRLAGAVRPGDGGHGAALEGRRHVGQGPRRPEPLPGVHELSAGIDRIGGRGRIRRVARKQPRMPGERASCGLRWAVGEDGPGVHRDDPVGDVEQPLGAVLGDHDRDPVPVPQVKQGGDQLVGGDRIELARRLVEQQHPRPHREHGCDRHPLAFAARERAGGALGEVAGAGHAQRVAGPRVDLGRLDAQVLDAERGLGQDAARHDLGLRVLEDEARVAGELAGQVAAGVEAGDPHAAVELTAVEAGDEPERGPKQRRLAASRLAHEQHELALVHDQVNRVERRPAAADVPVAHALERQGRQRATQANAAPITASAAAPAIAAGFQGLSSTSK